MTALGRAGGSLDVADFASSAEAAAAGRDGEVATAKVLDRLADQQGFTVIHDLRIPGAKANIDHVVVAGTKVWAIDSKLWKPGFYVTVAGRTYRHTSDGWERAEHADKRGLPLGHARLTAHLERHGARMQRPIMVVHPSRRTRRIWLWAFRPASDRGARVRVARAESLSFPSRQADPRIVAALTRLIN